MRFQVKLKVRLKVRFLDEVSGEAGRGGHILIYLRDRTGQDRTGDRRGEDLGRG